MSGEGGSVERGHADDHNPTAKAGTGAPKEGGTRGESPGAETALPGLYVLTEIKLHVSSGLRVKVIGRVATTADGGRGGGSVDGGRLSKGLLFSVSCLDCAQRMAARGGGSTTGILYAESVQVDGAVSLLPVHICTVLQLGLEASTSTLRGSWAGYRK